MCMYTQNISIYLLGQEDYFQCFSLATPSAYRQAVIMHYLLHHVNVIIFASENYTK